MGKGQNFVCPLPLQQGWSQTSTDQYKHCKGFENGKTPARPPPDGQPTLAPDTKALSAARGSKATTRWPAVTCTECTSMMTQKIQEVIYAMLTAIANQNNRGSAAGRAGPKKLKSPLASACYYCSWLLREYKTACRTTESKFSTAPRLGPLLCKSQHRKYMYCHL